MTITGEVMIRILEKITNAQRAEVSRKKKYVPVPELEKSPLFPVAVRPLSASLPERNGYGIIAEFKKRSPSRGIINSSATPGEVCPRYFDAGASAVSVLTNGRFFGGSNDDLLQARAACEGAILRKEFIIDEYQVIESKSIGADAILLIADILTGKEMRDLSRLASSLGMEVLFEIHDTGGIDKLPGDARLIGVNSRNLDNFTIDMEIPEKIIGRLPEGSIRIAESGIDSPQKLLELRRAGFEGFLIGEMFMKQEDPGESCREFIESLNRLAAGDRVNNPL